MNPRFSVHTADKTSPRGFPWIWFLRLAEILGSLIVLALVARDVSGLSQLSCGIPGKIAWNLACAVLSFLALIYLLLSSGLSRAFKILPWWIFIQIGLDALFFIFWISAAGTSPFSCNDFCGTCGYLGYDVDLYLNGFECYCGYYILYEKRNVSPNPNLGLAGGLQKRRGHVAKAGTFVARQAIDSIMVILFFLTLCSTAWWMWQNRRAGDNAGAATTSTVNNPESGIQQVPMEMKQDIPYSGGPAPQYTSVAPQQGNFPPASPGSGQYPQQQQGYTQQQQPQGYPQQQQPQGYPQQQPQQQQPYPQQQPQGYPQQQQQQSYPQQQQYPEQAPQGQGYYGGQQQGDVSPAQQTQQQDIPNYPTPTPEMQAGHGDGH